MTEKTLLVTKRFRVARVNWDLQSGSAVQKDVVRHPGSVVILPLLEDHQICLIRNHRVAVNQTLIELPAGTLEVDEIPLACARRELTEETGYSAGRMTHLTSFYAAPGILDEYMHLFLATQLVPGEPDREPQEEIENLVVGRDQALAMIENGQISDAKTIVGILFHDRFRR